MKNFALDYETFKIVLQASQKNLKEYLSEMLRENGFDPIVKKKFLYAAGDVPVLLVAHLDTVHSEQPSIICRSEDGRYLMSPQGIGGDDRCGVYMIMQILQEVRCHVLFCEDEERGGLGAHAFAKSRIRPRVNYIVEMDRRGNNDAVFYGCDNPKFTEFVLGYGFEEARGTFSDISVVAPYLDAAAVNISAGYYHEHRQHEYIDTDAMLNNAHRIALMVQENTTPYPYMQRWSQRSRHGRFSPFPSGGGKDDKERFLMTLPNDTKLLTSGCLRTSDATYMMDMDHTIYIYLEELGVAVESEHTYACNEQGEELDFSLLEAKRVPIMTMDTAMETLSI